MQDQVPEKVNLNLEKTKLNTTQHRLSVRGHTFYLSNYLRLHGPVLVPILNLMHKMSNQETSRVIKMNAIGM